MKTNKTMLAAALALSYAVALPLSAAELSAGTEINGQNLAQHLGDTFENHKISDLLTERMQVHEKTAWMLRSLLE